MLNLTNPKHPLSGIKFETAPQLGIFPELSHV